MRFWILISAISICAVPAAQGLPTGEFLIDTARLSMPGGDASVGFDGTNFLAVWRDFRRGRNDLLAARVDQSGRVLDPNDLLVAEEVGYSAPAIAFDGVNYLVVYVRNFHIRAKRVSPAGLVIEPEIVVSNEGESQTNPKVAYDGANYLVVWKDYRVDNDDIYCARVSPAGVVLDTASIPVADSLFWEERPDVCATDSGFWVVWETGYNPTNIHAARVTSNGQVLDHNGFPVVPNPAQQAYPATASDGANALIAWRDDRAGEGDIYGARLTWAGQVLDTNGFLISGATDFQGPVDIGFDGTNYFLAWEDYRNKPQAGDIYAARVTPDGQVLDPNGIQVEVDTLYEEIPAITCGDSASLVLWTGQILPSLEPGIQSKRVSASGVVLDTTATTVSTYCPAQWDPAVAYDGTNYLVVWQTERPGNWEIHATRLTPACVVLDSPSVVVAQTGRNEADADEDVVFDGTDFVVVWEDNGRNPETTDICGARVSTGGQVLERFAVVRQPGSQYVPRLAHGAGNQLLLVYEGWTSVYQGQLFNTDHIWGKLSPLTGFSEDRPSTAQGSPLPATIVRGVLFLSEASGGERGATNVLLDISGRKVLDLLPGPNDVSRLAPGVYFVVPGSVRGTGTIGPTRKVVITK